MKKLLNFVSVINIFSSFLFSSFYYPKLLILLNNTKIETLHKSYIQGDHFHWNEKANLEKIKIKSTPYGIFTSAPVKIKKIYNFTFGQLREKPSFNKLTFEYSFENIFVKWGDEIMDSWKWEPMAISFTKQNNYKFTDTEDRFFDYATKIKIYEKLYQSSGVAYCQASLKIGLTWYQENNQYYIQILINQFLNTVHSYSSAIAVTDLGEIIKLSYF